MVVCQQAPPRRSSQRGISNGLWGVSLSSRVHPRTRQLPWPARGWDVDGPASVAAHDLGGRDYFCAERKKIEPWIDPLIFSVPPSRPKERRLVTKCVSPCRIRLA